MPRDHSLALELQDRLDVLDAEREEVMAQMTEADPAVAEQTELVRQTRTITDIAFLAEVSAGQVGQRYSGAMGRVLAHLSAEPTIEINGKSKPKTCEIHLTVFLTSVMGSEKLDGNKSQSYLKDIDLAFKIDAKVPKYESDVVTATVIPHPDGSIKDVRINPDHNETPRQLSMFPRSRDKGEHRIDD